MEGKGVSQHILSWTHATHCIGFGSADHPMHVTVTAAVSVWTIWFFGYEI
jgi:hypothetical protein